jgi:hypothetical protein
MEIRCLICGKKYCYDRKICQDCEEYSINSGVADFEGNRNHKWNCSVFLEIKSVAYKSKNFCDLTKDLSPEPKNLEIDERESYDWNCDSANRLYRKTEESLPKITIGDFYTHMRSKVNSHLFYE